MRIHLSFRGHRPRNLLSCRPKRKQIPRSARNDNLKRPPFVQPARRPLRHFVTYGSTNKYRPVTRSKASGNTAKRPTPPVYFFSAIATMLTMTATVKAMDSQRWICLIHLFQLNGALAATAGFCEDDST